MPPMVGRAALGVVGGRAVVADQLAVALVVSSRIATRVPSSVKQQRRGRRRAGSPSSARSPPVVRPVRTVPVVGERVCGHVLSCTALDALNSTTSRATTLWRSQSGARRRRPRRRPTRLPHDPSRDGSEADRPRRLADHEQLRRCPGAPPVCQPRRAPPAPTRPARASRRARRRVRRARPPRPIAASASSAARIESGLAL